jgi:hypothetical protein
MMSGSERTLSQTKPNHGISQKVPLTIIIGALIREAFSFWTGHPSDFELWVRLGYAFNRGVNPYGVLPPVPGLSFANLFSAQNAATIAYLPFWPLVTGLIYAAYSVIGFGNRFAYYFLLKQPVIVGDVGLAYLLYSYVFAKNPRQSIFVLSLWLLSPFMIIISGMWGMFDSIAMAFIMISVMSKSHLKSAFWTGVAILAKSVPIIYAVPTTIKRARRSFDLLVSVGLPVVVSFATFTVMGWPISTINSDLLSAAGRGGESMSVWDSFFYLNYLGILQPLNPDVYRILGFVWIPLVLAFTFVAFRRFRFETDYGLIQSLIIVTLAFLIFKGRVTEQYAIYLFALSAIDVAVWNPKRKNMLLFSMLVGLVYLVSNNYFLIRFLSPVDPHAVQIELTMSQAIGPIRNAVNFLSGSLFTCLNIWYLIAAMKRWPLRDSNAKEDSASVKTRRSGRL